MFKIYENNNWKEDHHDYHQSEEQNQEDHHNHLQLTLEPRGLKITNFKKLNMYIIQSYKKVKYWKHLPPTRHLCENKIWNILVGIVSMI